MAGKFVITRGKDSKFYFALKAGNGEKILQSQGYADKRGCLNGVESVRKNSVEEKRFTREVAKDGRFYFTLLAANSQQIGRSQMYKSESGRDNGIASVGRNAAEAAVLEQLDTA